MIPHIIAHRGANTEAPENSRPAFYKALASPIHGIELDVQMTRDGVPVIYHDRTLFKILGKRKRVSDVYLDEMASADWGGWYAPAFAGEPLLTFRETLELFAHRTHLLIEIKSRKPERESGHSLRLTRAVLDHLADPAILPHRDHIRILSFDPEVLACVSQNAPDLKLVLNLEWTNSGPTGPDSFIHLPGEHIDILHAICVRLKDLSDGLANQIRGLGKQVWTYSCNIPRQVKRALDLDVDLMMTDRPAWIGDHLKLSG